MLVVEGSPFSSFVNVDQSPTANVAFCAGHKDWARIHERAFAKMDSIDVYLKKRHERTQSVSAMKVQEMTERMRTALTSLKKLKSPGTPLAQKVSFM